MARRAHDSLPRLRALAAELAELEAVAIVKLGLDTDHGGHEHLWFEVHGFDEDAVDATLMNAPFHIARLKQGDRGRQSLAALSDWAILTPIGRIDPRSTRTLRHIRDNWDRLKALLEEAKQQAG